MPDYCRNCSLSAKVHPWEFCREYVKPVRENLVPITCVVQGCSAVFYAADAAVHYQHSHSGNVERHRAEPEQAVQGGLF